MTTQHPVFAFFIFMLALTCSFLLAKWSNFPFTKNRYASIDGLRGLLGISVFIHHSSIWYPFIHTGIWEDRSSPLYSELGKTSVSLFFMITSFLFISKLLNSTGPVQWPAFFISRFLRIAPLYYVSVSGILLICMYYSGWQLQVNGSTFLMELFNMATFNILHGFSFNNFPYANLVNAAVLWTLSVEWIFYLSIPFLSLFLLKYKTNYLYAGISFILIASYFLATQFNSIIFLCFAGGAVAPFLMKYTDIQKHIQKVSVSVLLLLGIAAACYFHSVQDLLYRIALIGCFTVVATGNTFFGLLKFSGLKLLSEICYSTYLLHGILLFLLFYVVYGMEAAKKIPESVFCYHIFALTPLVILVSFSGFLWIEKPFMILSKKTAAYFTGKQPGI